MKINANYLLTGIAFSALWASASVAGKFGLFSAEPLILFTARFLGAGSLLLVLVLISKQTLFPNEKKEWMSLTIFAALNTTLYLGLFCIALQFITPGITSLALALNPLFISIISALWMKRKILTSEWISILLGMTGIMIASYPLLQTSYATPSGLILLAVSMTAYSAGAVYFASIQWKLPRMTVNAWQNIIGGLMLIPFAIVMHYYSEKVNTFDLRFWSALLWLIVPVSIMAIQLWLRLLKSDAVKASLWLYLCPVFGFGYSVALLGEPFTIHTLIGTLFVMGALYIGQKK